MWGDVEVIVTMVVGPNGRSFKAVIGEHEYRTTTGYGHTFWHAVSSAVAWRLFGDVTDLLEQYVYDWDGTRIHFQYRRMP